MKMGVNTGKTLVAVLVDPFVVGGVALLVLGGLLMTLALKEGELTVVHPLLGLGFVWVLFMGSFVGETVVWTQYLGVGTIIIGTGLITKSRRRR